MRPQIRLPFAYRVSRVALYHEVGMLAAALLRAAAMPADAAARGYTRR